MMNIRIHYRVNGRSVSKEDLAGALAAQALSVVAENLRGVLWDRRCPEHGNIARLTLTPNATSLDLGVDACCLSFEDEIADAVMEILGDEEDEP